MSRPEQARVKIQAPSEEIIEKILEVLDENFLCVSSPARRSDGGGFHIFVTVRV